MTPTGIVRRQMERPDVRQLAPTNAENHSHPVIPTQEESRARFRCGKDRPSLLLRRAVNHSIYLHIARFINPDDPVAAIALNWLWLYSMSGRCLICKAHTRRIVLLLDDFPAVPDIVGDPNLKCIASTMDDSQRRSAFQRTPKRFGS